MKPSLTNHMEESIGSLCPICELHTVVDGICQVCDWGCEHDAPLLVPGRVTLPESELRCSCDQEQGDSECARHPSCGECGKRTTHPVGTCELHAPLATGGAP